MTTRVKIFSPEKPTGFLTDELCGDILDDLKFTAAMEHTTDGLLLTVDGREFMAISQRLPGAVCLAFFSASRDVKSLRPKIDISTDQKRIFKATRPIRDFEGSTVTVLDFD